MPDVFYAMKRDISNEPQTLRRRVISEPEYREKNGQSDEYYSTDSADDESSDRREAAKRGQFEQQQQSLSKTQKFWKRFYSTWIMIFGFFAIIYVGHTALCCFVTVFQVLPNHRALRIPVSYLRLSPFFDAPKGTKTKIFNFCCDLVFCGNGIFAVKMIKTNFTEKWQISIFVNFGIWKFWNFECFEFSGSGIP